MAINDDKHDESLGRDPHLARLYEVASGEEPTAALDAAILAAARREVSARPHMTGQAAAGDTAPPVLRVKRNWYVPVSIAAILVLSVSVVTMVHEEKSDELVQPTGSAAAPAATSAPKVLPQSAPVEAPATEPPKTAAAAKPETASRDAPPSKPKLAQEKSAGPAPDAGVSGYADSYAQKQRAQAEKAEAMADRATPVPKTVLPAAPARRDAATGNSLAKPEAGAAPPVSSAPSAPMAKRRAEPFPATGERETQASAAPGAVRKRSESSGVAARDAAPGVPQSAPAAEAVVPRQAPLAEEMRARTSPSVAQGRVAAAPPPAAAVAPKPALKSAETMLMTRPAWLTELENQPPDKWLERLAQLKRDGRNADADELLTEFRRRFPDHPASAR